ncbi:4Fe-4S dicluster domain-containing protein [Adlercreutzia mucosicola]|uniref:4Fe-4S dicluster domain-containing protein n=1 Tax=Adlercreutzia mucosicola TaxID=580026 RepID=UPI002B24E374|nr:4Fe-4S dicluster domain-containing protein [Adlercreutzia mucosicola]MEB1814903.1 4Fe-4S dicluster domain-containing protein [Adlercreutzia mucosicola]
MAYGMVINLRKCVGCRACVTACKGANGTPPTVFRSRVNQAFEGEYPQVKCRITPLLCMQCENAPCVEVCPSGASAKGDDGIVTIDKESCIGCKSCVAACPYQARFYIESGDGYFGADLTAYEEARYGSFPVGTVDKCDFCKGNGRLENGEGPACAQACIAKARIFGDIDELRSMIDERSAVQLMPEQGTEPSVYYIPA